MTAYLDHASTTPVRASALAAMTEQLARTGNASSLHTAGRAARRIVEESRERIAAAIGARPSEVVFTSGGTESDNLAILGTLRAAATTGRTRVVASSIEHHAVLDTLEHAITDEGAQVSWVDPDARGVLAPAIVRAAATREREDASDVAVASVMWANNEIGVVQDIAGISAALDGIGVPLHTDASQAVGHVPVNFTDSGASLMTVASHKLGGPTGIGALVARRDAQIEPLSHGGGQERGIRSGTLDVPAVRGFAVALEEAVAQREDEARRIAWLRDRLIAGALALDPGIRVTGAWNEGDVLARLPGNAHLLVSGCEGDSLLYLLDAAGVECSTGSACQAGVPQPSHVVLALGYTEQEARGALRLSLGHTSTDADVETFLAALPAAIERARRAAGTSGSAAASHGASPLERRRSA